VAVPFEKKHKTFVYNKKVLIFAPFEHSTSFVVFDYKEEQREQAQ
jgi:hypothetical protein